MSVREALSSADAAIAAVHARLRAAGQLTPELEREHRDIQRLIAQARSLELAWGDQVARLTDHAAPRQQRRSVTARIRARGAA